MTLARPTRLFRQRLGRIVDQQGPNHAHRSHLLPGPSGAVELGPLRPSQAAFLVGAATLFSSRDGGLAEQGHDFSGRPGAELHRCGKPARHVGFEAAHVVVAVPGWFACVFDHDAASRRRKEVLFRVLDEAVDARSPFLLVGVVCANIVHIGGAVEDRGDGVGEFDVIEVGTILLVVGAVENFVLAADQANGVHPIISFFGPLGIGVVASIAR